MSHIHIRKRHGLSHTEARRTAERLAEDLASEYGARYRWQEDDLVFSSSGVQGKLHVGKDMVDIRVNLGLMLRPLRGKIETGIRSRLEEILG